MVHTHTHTDRQINFQIYIVLRYTYIYVYTYIYKHAYTYRLLRHYGSRNKRCLCKTFLKEFRDGRNLISEGSGFQKIAP